MSGGLVDDYLSQLLGAAAADLEAAKGPAAPVPSAAPPPEPVVAAPAVPTPTPTAPEPAVIAPTVPPTSGDAISEDEFEALLDALHGDKPPGASEAPTAPAPTAPAPAAPAVAPVASSGSEEISEDEFEALLDALHGDQPPGAIEMPAPPAAVAPAQAAAPAGDEISEDEFEALLDALHGGKPPGATEASGALAAAAAVAVAVAREAREGFEDSVDDRREDDADSWRGQERRASRRTSRWLRLRVHEQDYGVELLKVQEVLLPVPVLPMRETDIAILGVMNLRGVVVPVLDLGVWLGVEEVEDSAQTRYVVLEQNGECLALKVSAVLDVHAIADGQVEPAEHTLASPGTAMLKGVTRLNSQPVILLDAGGLLG